MPSRPVPTQSLYIGAAGEHYIISECFRHNMEAFKLPIDKGFDLVVTRAYVHLTDAAPEPAASNEMPVYLQVKSRQVVLPPLATDAQRPCWEGCFPIKEADLDLLCRTGNSALACVLFFDTRGELLRSRTTIAWWMSSDYLTQLRRSRHFIACADGGELELWVRYREPAPNTTYRQNPYISLLKQNGSQGARPGARACGDLLGEHFFDFATLGKAAAAGG